MQLPLLLEMAATSLPDRPILGLRKDSLSLADLDERVRSGAALLASIPGERIAFVGLNSRALPIAIFASALAGKPFAPLNYRLADADLGRLLARTAPSVAIVDDDMVARASGIEGVTVVARSAFLAACEVEAPMAAPSVEADIAVLLFTSGTTGEPKAAVLRHRHLTSYVISTVEFLGADEDEAALVCVPPYHIAGISALLTGIYAGRRIVHLDAFTPEGWIAVARDERISHAMVVPTMLDRILDVLAKTGESLPALQTLSYGGGRMPQSVVERALELMPHVAFVNAYGLTETSSTIAILGPDDHRLAIASDDPLIRRRLGSVGRPLPSLELEIRGPDGRALGPNQSGEIFVRGEQVAGEYLHKRAVTEDGWFATNDGGWRDEDGYLFVEGRLDDVIVRGGENISPGEIEDVLRRHPGVLDVAVLGLPDDRWGEKVVAVIVPREGPPDEHSLAEWVRTQLRSTKTPEAWIIRADLPYNETGKLLRRVLKAELQLPERSAA